jgi:hypothetical protein
MVPLSSNPFAILTLIAGPAVLTNASSVLALGTSNRFARAIDRARSLSLELQSSNVDPDFVSSRMRQLDRAEKRSLLLVKALSAFYLAIGCFAAASFIALLGAGFADAGWALGSRITLALGLLVGVVGVGSIAHGCLILLQETRLVVLNLRDEATFVRGLIAARSASK